MNSSQNKIFMLITLISIYFCADILAQRTTSRLENSRLESARKIQNIKDNSVKTTPEKAERIKGETIKPTRVQVTSRNDRNNNRSPRLPINNSSSRRESEIRKDIKVNSSKWRSGDVKRRRITHSPKVYITRPKYSKPFIDYHNPYFFRCFTYHNEIINHYPSFPLRFVSAKFNYLYNEKNNYSPSFENEGYQIPMLINYFEVNIAVQVRSQYWEEFGILVQYSNGNEQIILFNEDDKYLFPGSVYEFSKVVALENFGNINIRLGYYDSYTDSFYPAVYSRNETDLSIFVSRNSSYTHR